MSSTSLQSPITPHRNIDIAVIYSTIFESTPPDSTKRENVLFVIEIKRSLATKLFVLATVATDCNPSILTPLCLFSENLGRASSHCVRSDMRIHRFISSARALHRVIRYSSRCCVRLDFRQSQPSRRSGRIR
jgi:hypothetical protein